MRLIFIACLVLIGPIALAAPTTGIEQISTADPAAAPAGFERYENDQGGYQVMAPGTPKIGKTIAKSKLGPVVYRSAMSNGALMAAWGDLPFSATDDAMRNSMFDGGRDGMLKSTHSTLLSEKKISLDGRPLAPIHYVQ